MCESLTSYGFAILMTIFLYDAMDHDCIGLEHWLDIHYEGMGYDRNWLRCNDNELCYLRAGWRMRLVFLSLIVWS